VPPLTFRLVGRPPATGMTAAYARLCLGYVGAVCLRRGTVGLGDFASAALSDLGTLVLAQRLSVEPDDNPDLNALQPVRVELDLEDGRTVACDVADVLGSPARPLLPEAARAKFIVCGGSDALWQAITALDAASTDLLTYGLTRT